jgi:hypothetical protein
LEALAVIWAPVRTLSRVAEEQRVLLGFAVTALYAALSIIGAGLGVFTLLQAPSQLEGQNLPPEFFERFLSLIGALAVVWAVVSPFLFWLLVSGLMHLVTNLFSGTGPFSRMLAVVGVAQAPLVIASAMQIPITGLQILLVLENPAATAAGWLSGLLNLAAFLWFIVLVVIGAAFARRVGYGESAGSCAISCSGCIGLIILVFVIIVAVFVLLSGVLNSSGMTT